MKKTVQTISQKLKTFSQKGDVLHRLLNFLSFWNFLENIDNTLKALCSHLFI